jgi:chromosome segregation ATPase
MQEGSNDAIGQIAMQLNESIASIKHEMDQIFKNITAHASSVDAIISQSAQRLSKVPQYLEVLDSSALKLQSFAAKTEESSKQLTQASGDLVKFNDSVGKYTAEMDATGSMFKQTAEMTERIAKGSQDTYTLLAEQYNDLLEQNESSMVKFQEQVDAYKRQLEAGVQHTFTQFDKQLSDFASGLSASVAEINDAIVDLTETRGNK